MSDINPFAPPKSDLFDTSGEDHGAKIASLDVSSSWKHRFYLLEKAGGPRMGKLGKLPLRDRMAAGFNILGFLLGPVYYLAKGMWRKALSLFALCALALAVIDVAGFVRVSEVLSYGIGAVFAVRANADYYKKMVLGENGWW
jgi:hypothetical protein